MLLPLHMVVDPEVVMEGAVLTVAVTAIRGDSHMLPASDT